MSSPLWNTIRSFWTPERTDDPEWLRLVRIDKGIFLTSVAAALIAGAGLIVCGIHLAALIF